MNPALGYDTRAQYKSRVRTSDCDVFPFIASFLVELFVT